MRLSHLILDNFKAFGRRTVFPLAPLTVLIGENSAGKSSAIQSLLLLKQTLASSFSGEQAPLPVGTSVDLGSFRNLRYRGSDSDNAVEISLIFPLQPGSVALARYGGLGVRFLDGKGAGTEIESLPCYLGVDQASCHSAPAFHLRPTSERPDPRVQLRVTGPRIFSPQINDDAAVWPALLEGVQAIVPAAQELLRDYIELLREHEFFSPENEKRTEFNKRHEAVFKYERRDTYNDFGEPVPVGRDLADTLDHINRHYLAKEALDHLTGYDLARYLADVRSVSWERLLLRGFLPDTYMTWEEEQYRGGVEDLADVAKALCELAGKDLFPALPDSAVMLGNMVQKLAQDTDYIGPLRRQFDRVLIMEGTEHDHVDPKGEHLVELLYRRPELLEEVNQALTQFGFQSEVELQRYQLGGLTEEAVVSLVMKNRMTGAMAYARDVGFGVSQILPVVAECLAYENRLILIEQPEIHLHPRLQAELGSLLWDSVARRGNQVVVETHSEYLVRRLQRLIREPNAAGARLSPEQVSILYIQEGEHGSTVKQLRLDEEGRFLDSWPPGFLDTGFNESFPLDRE